MPYPCCCGSFTPCLASFTWAITSGTTVAFTDTSVDPVAWLWTFRLGHTSTAQNPTHNFTAPGVYPVSLRITLADGTQCTVIETVTINLPCGVCITQPGVTVSVTLPALSDNRCNYCAELAGGYILTKISACTYQYREALGNCYICDLGEPEKAIELVMEFTIAAGFGANPTTMTLDIRRDFDAAAEDPCPATATTYEKSFGAPGTVECVGIHTLTRTAPNGNDDDCNGWPATLGVTVSA